MVKTMGTRGKINAIWWNIKINLQKLVDKCGYELPTNLQNFAQKDLTDMKIFLKVLGELLFWNTRYVTSIFRTAFRAVIDCHSIATSITSYNSFNRRHVGADCWQTVYPAVWMGYNIAPLTFSSSLSAVSSRAIASPYIPHVTWCTAACRNCSLLCRTRQLNQ